jgi:hypothetical protein
VINTEAVHPSKMKPMAFAVNGATSPLKIKAASEIQRMTLTRPVTKPALIAGKI